MKFSPTKPYSNGSLYPWSKAMSFGFFSIDPKGDYLKKVASKIFLIEVINDHGGLKGKLANFFLIFSFFDVFLNISIKGF